MDIQLLNTVITLLITIGTIVATAVWFLSNQLARIYKQIDKISDLLRDYQKDNDYRLQAEHDRITALKMNLKDYLYNHEKRISELEKYLNKEGYVTREKGIKFIDKNATVHNEFEEITTIDSDLRMKD